MEDSNKNKIGHKSRDDTEYKSASEVAYWKDVADLACRVMINLLTKTSLLRLEIHKSINGKNKDSRGAALGRADVIQSDIQNELRPFRKVFDHVKNGQDLDVAPAKLDALDLCAKHGNFGSYIKNTNEKLYEEDK
jgi:hypothetical protein